MSGVDRDTYTWEPLAGTTHENAVDKDLKECEVPGGEAAGSGAATDSPTISIMRSEGSTAVAACMANKGYRKAYASRSGW
ncbi:MAG: hypothetical protein ACLQJR_32200 [Stellaceae bacterium]